MADVGIFTKNADIAVLAGVNASVSGAAVEQTDQYVLNVEAMINVDSTFDYSAAWTAGTLDETMKHLLTQAGAAKCAMNVINYDPSAYSARDRETMLDTLNTMYEESMKILKDKDKQQYIQDGTT